ncbi:hypothetical protein [Oryza sativa Japonica Group]|uniref:Uncharacterized protein n=1 Tax=Oryza sativa subsp. japonica TaxID=39947 RepID=Q5ZBG8_ORYSJ|nr:hypothetical protein [Oryza sativa Japonica Group]BAD61527.1 hypothetical protein [Oryza sativa Japonica Group]
MKSGQQRHRSLPCSDEIKVEASPPRIDGLLGNTPCNCDDHFQLCHQHREELG